MEGAEFEYVRCRRFLDKKKKLRNGVLQIFDHDQKDSKQVQKMMTPRCATSLSRYFKKAQKQMCEFSEKKKLFGALFSGTKKLFLGASVLLVRKKKNP